MFETDIFDTPVSELYHHGILGQKWGVRNGPPYPLGASDKSASERRASRRKSLDRSARKTYTGGSGRMLRRGAIVAVAALAAYGAYKAGYLDEFRSTGEKAVRSALREMGPAPMDNFRNFTPPTPPTSSAPQPKREPIIRDPKTGFRLKADTGPRTIQSIEDDVRVINPSRNQTNCVACSVTADLRARGYDVVAKFRDNGNIFGTKELDLLYDKVKWNSVGGASSTREAFTSMSKHLESYGNGARGIFIGKFNENQLSKIKRLGWSFDSHAIAWEVVNGKAVFADGQRGTLLHNALEEIAANYDKDGLIFARLDDQSIDPDFIMNFSQSR